MSDYRAPRMSLKVQHQPRRTRYLVAASLICVQATTLLVGQTHDAASDPILTLPDFAVFGQRVANDAPAATFPAAVSYLRFEPQVDLQARNFGEAQGDITVRGGIFEGTAVQLGGLTIIDPQTGHYTADLPVPPMMLGAPRVATGADEAFGAMNATAAAIDYGWSEIVDGGQASVGWGEGSLNRQSFYFGQVLRSGGGDGPAVAADVEVSRSRAGGVIKDGDHRFSRTAGRLQMATRTTRTELFAGYQAKFFGWPNLYTPFGVAETENLQTTLVAVAHRFAPDAERVFEASAYWRRNRDDYEYNRYQPGLYNPYQHETRIGGAFGRAGFPAGPWRIALRGEVAADSIESTSLVFGHFRSRTTWKVSSAASRRWPVGSGAWETRFGATLDDTNRESSAVSPLAELAWETARGPAGTTLRWYAQSSESTRVPGYTALNSSPTAGLFRGNAELGREHSRNLETGVMVHDGDWSVQLAVFHRSDDPLVDWTYSRTAPNARTASLVDIATTGAEIVAVRQWTRLRVVAGYTALTKDADYRASGIDGSFYALNFPRHRFTLAVVARLGGGFELRSDNEFRVQEKNPLRSAGGDSAFLSSLGLYWTPRSLRQLELSLVADNLWDSEFQELPAVPAAPRQIAGGATWRW